MISAETVEESERERGGEEEHEAILASGIDDSSIENGTID